MRFYFEMGWGFRVFPGLGMHTCFSRPFWHFYASGYSMGLGRYFYLMKLLFVRKEKRNGDSSAVFQDFKTVTREILYVPILTVIMVKNIFLKKYIKIIFFIFLKLFLIYHIKII
jgi:hypothetical protein